VKRGVKRKNKEIVRYTLWERVVHWSVALSFIYLMLTGLALYSPRLFWMASVLGGGTTVRVWHPFAGVVFSVALVLMSLSWARCMWLYPEDRQWLLNIWSYITHKEEGLPEAGRFNAGQKMLFWLMSFSGLLLLLSGIPLWFPHKFSWDVRLASILVHEIATLAAIGGIIVHVYMGTLAVPGSLGAMAKGKVTDLWAKTHHPRWYRRLRQKGLI
jgi:formate dehydrogenase subunit gamma